MQSLRKLALLAVVALGLAACSEDNGIGPSNGAPSAPANVAVSVDGTSITVTWTASTGTPAPTYSVTLTAPGETARTDNAASALTSVFEGLTHGQTYTAQVTATNSEGSANSTVASGVIPDAEATFVEVTGDILSNTTWTSDKVWVLTQPIFVGRDCGTDGAKAGCAQATLTIEPGTTVVGKTDLSQGVRGAYLVVSRGSKLVADATGENRRPTASEVIVFTSDKPRGQRARGDWGGLIVNGRARTNSGSEAEGEGDSGLYGGALDTDNSGIIRGVRIEFAGDDVTPTDQLNGLALQSVGSGTTISYLQIHYNVDDGVEPFGGTVSVDHLVVTGIGDDSVDGTDGYRGFIQFIVGQQRADRADNGMELSNDGEATDASPQSTAVIANATMIGAASSVVTGEIANGSGSDRGVQMREGSHYRVYNSIVTGFDDAGFCVENAPTVVAANNRMAGQTTPKTTLSFEGNVLWSNKSAGGTGDNFEACSGYSEAENKAFFNKAGFNNLLADPGLPTSAFSFGSMAAPPNVIPAAAPAGYTPFALGGVALDNDNLFAPADGRTLEATTYPGAVAPGTALAEAWYTGWTVWTIDGADSRPNSTGN